MIRPISPQQAEPAPRATLQPRPTQSRGDARPIQCQASCGVGATYRERSGHRMVVRLTPIISIASPMLTRWLGFFSPISRMDARRNKYCSRVKLIGRFLALSRESSRWMTMPSAAANGERGFLFTSGGLEHPDSTDSTDGGYRIWAGEIVHSGANLAG